MKPKSQRILAVAIILAMICATIYLNQLDNHPSTPRGGSESTSNRVVKNTRHADRSSNEGKIKTANDSNRMKRIVASFKKDKDSVDLHTPKGDFFASSAELKEFWEKLEITEAMPSVDFNHEVILLVKAQNQSRNQLEYKVVVTRGNMKMKVSEAKMWTRRRQEIDNDRIRLFATSREGIESISGVPVNRQPWPKWPTPSLESKDKLALVQDAPSLGGYQMPKPKQFLTSHETIAQFKGVDYPTDINSAMSGNWACFDIVKYLKFENPKDGDGMASSQIIRLTDPEGVPIKSDQKYSDFRYDVKGVSPYDILNGLSKGDKVLLSWIHVGGGLNGRPYFRLEKIDEHHAAGLIAEVEESERAILASKKDGSYYEPEEFAKRLAQRSPKFRNLNPSEMASITKLDFDELPLSDDDFTSIGKLTKLESLEFGYKTGIKWDSLRHLSNLKSLKHLDLPLSFSHNRRYSGWEEADTAKKLLPQFTALENLKLNSYIPSAEEDIKDLRLVLPNCQIKLEKYYN